MDHFGALVGWTHQDLGERLMLRIESLHSIDREGHKQPDTTRLLMTRQQAALLGSYLVELSGHALPEPGERSLLRRLFG